MNQIVICLSMRQPYAWAIVHGWKTVENREMTFGRTHTGPFLVHTGKECTKKEYAKAVERILKANPTLEVPPLEKLNRGGIVGRARCDGYVTASEDPWFDGPLGVVLSQAKPLPFLKMPGALGWFACPRDIVEQLKKLTRSETRAVPPRAAPPVSTEVERFPGAF